MNTFILNTFRKTYSYLNHGEKRRLYALALLMIFSGVVDIAGLASILPVVSIAIKPELIQENEYVKMAYDFLNLGSLKWFLLALFGGSFSLILFRNGLALATFFLQAKFSANVSKRLSVAQLKDYLDRDLDFILKNDSANLIRDTNVVPQHFSNFILTSQLQIISESVVIIMIIAAIITFDFVVFICLLFTIVPLTWVFYSLSKKKISDLGREQHQINPKLYLTVQEALFGFVDMKLHSQETFFIKQFRNLLTRVKYIEVWLKVLQGSSAKMIELMAFLGVGVLFLIALFIEDNSAYLFSLIGVFIAATYRLIPTYNRILQGVIRIKNNQHIFDIYDDLSQRVIPVFRPKSIGHMDFNTEIEFENVSFSYDSKSPVLKDIGLTIKRGERIGIIGKSGSGKTTIINLLLRFLKEQQGQILVDGVPLDSSNIREWRSKIGYVQQNVFIKTGSILDNIAYCLEPELQNEKRALEALRIVKLEELITDTDRGIQSRLEEGGANLSGGQRQRIAIARALYREAEIFIFDEATSALDTETEEEINQAIKALGEKKHTVIIVAHRYTSLKHCDWIYELDSGRLKRKLSYSELQNESMKA